MPQPPPQSTNAEYEVNSIDDNDKDPEQEAEPSLFDILHDDEEDDDDGDDPETTRHQE